MKIAFIILATVFLSFSIKAQESVLSKGDIKQFSAAALYQYQYGNGFFTALCNEALAKENYSPFDRTVAMEKLNTDSKAREIIFQAIANRCGDYTSLSNQMLSLGMDVKTTEYITSYIYEKYKSNKAANPQ